MPRLAGTVSSAPLAGFAKSFLTAGYVGNSGGVIGAKEKPASCPIPVLNSPSGDFMLEWNPGAFLGEDVEGVVGLSECSLHQQNSMRDSVQAILGIK